MGTLRKGSGLSIPPFRTSIAFAYQRITFLLFLWRGQLQETSCFGDEQVLRFLESYVIRLLYVFFS